MVYVYVWLMQNVADFVAVLDIESNNEDDCFGYSVF